MLSDHQCYMYLTKKNVINCDKDGTYGNIKSVINLQVIFHCFDWTMGENTA